MALSGEQSRKHRDFDGTSKIFEREGAHLLAFAGHLAINTRNHTAEGDVVVRAVGHFDNRARDAPTHDGFKSTQRMVADVEAKHLFFETQLLGFVKLQLGNFGFLGIATLFGGRVTKQTHHSLITLAATHQRLIHKRLKHQ